MNKFAITYNDILKAQDNISSGVVRTPERFSSVLSRETGVELYLKYEIFQNTSSFKDRGALNKLLNLTEDEKKRGVIANSAGNHAQGIAYHAARLKIPATIVMPKTTPFNKVKRTESHGARVVLAGDSFAESQLEAQKIMEEEGLLFISPFDDPYIMAGTGTIALEMLETFPDLDCLVVPIGGGGLISGIAIAAKHINPTIKIYGVQSDVFPSMKMALKGKTIEPKDQTIAEGIAVKTPGTLTLPVVKDLVEDILIVNEDTIEHAINMLMEQEKVVVEGAGASSLAAILQFNDLFLKNKTGLILAGGNIDPRILASSLTRGLIRDGRMSRFKVTTLDQPGGLAKMTDVVAKAGGNVIEVYHKRQFAPIALKYTEIELLVETKDEAHRDRVANALREAGYEVETKTPTQD